MWALLCLFVVCVGFVCVLCVCGVVWCGVLLCVDLYICECMYICMHVLYQNYPLVSKLIFAFRFDHVSFHSSSWIFQYSLFPLLCKLYRTCKNALILVCMNNLKFEKNSKKICLLSSVSGKLPTGSLSNIPWRRTGVKYANNEVQNI